MVFAIVGGVITGLILKLIGNAQELEGPRPGETAFKLSANIGDSLPGSNGTTTRVFMPEDNYFDDNMFFEVEEDEYLIAKQVD